MMGLENVGEIKPESKEKEPFEANLRVDFIRHGKPSYTPEEIESGQPEGELTEEGKKTVEDSAKKLADDIDKDKELVMLWASPRRRVQQSAGILKKIFNEEKIELIKTPKTKQSLADVKITGGYVKELIETGVIADWMNYWTTHEPPQGVEKPEEVKRRLERVITYLERIARVVHPLVNRKLHFICLGHEETVRDLLEEGYGTGTKKGEGPSYGEILRMDIFKSSPEKDTTLKLKYRDIESELGFNKEERRLYSIKNE